ncbi:MAG: PhnD/SsuA/transferrin family substrate-binding protein [Neisseriaceae bacterium]|nr:PhnD/SsuA/transferrin family substrate-binding protein [Neisseriaceae bacterium]
MMKKRGIGRYMMLALALLLGWAPLWAEAKTWHLGILAQRGLARTEADWRPWLNWLNQSLPGEQFELVPLDLKGLQSAVEEGKVDLVLSNQAQFLQLSSAQPVHWLVSLRDLRQIHSSMPNEGRTGSVILVRKSSPYTSIESLQGQRVAAVDEQAFGGYLLGFKVFLDHGLRAHKDYQVRFTGFPIDRTLEALGSQQVDAAIAPVCLLENMAAEGQLNADDFRVLGSMPNRIGCLSSTLLLPNWALAAMPDVPLALSSKLTSLLLSQSPPDLPQWTPPVSTMLAEDILRSINRHPHQQTFWQTMAFWAQQYSIELALFVALVVLMCLNHIWIGYMAHRKTKQLAQAYERMREYEQALAHQDRISILGEMASGFAHEINQPLSAIRHYAEGSAYRLQVNDPDNMALPIFKKIIGQVQRCTDIMNNLRSWAKRDEQQPAVTVNLAQQFQHTVSFIQMQNRHKDCHITIKAEADLTVYMVPSVLEQVLCNCVLNSIQAQATEVHITAYRHEGRVNIDLSDNGDGFAPEQLAFPFVPFRTTKLEGLGLGLVICERLILSQGGTFTLGNRLDGNGAVITLTLPSAAA